MAASVGEISVALMLDEAGFAAGLEAARSSLSGFAGAVGQALGAASAPASADGAQCAIAFASGLAAGAPQAGAAAAQLGRSAVSAARGGASGASAVGSAFAAGLASGIRAGGGGVAAAAASVARAAAEAARAALAIHSPSRVTEELGEHFDRGFIRGVEGMRPEVARAVRDAVGVAPPAGYGAGASAALPTSAPSAPIDYERLADAMDRRQMVLTMDNRRLAEVQTRETARAQSARNRSLALGYGKR